MDLGNDSFDISHTYQDTSFNITINRERTRFFQNIPSTDLTIYTNAMADPIFEDSLFSFLNQFNDLENVPETLNDLLHFCRTAYKDQFIIFCKFRRCDRTFRYIKLSALYQFAHR